MWWRTGIKTRQTLCNSPIKSRPSTFFLAQYHSHPPSFKRGPNIKHSRSPRSSPNRLNKAPKESLPKLVKDPLSLKSPSPENLLIDHKSAKTWSDLQIPPEVIEGITCAIPEAAEPEYAQKQFLATVNSDMSLVWNSLPGCGISTALDVALLSRQDRINVRNSTSAKSMGVNHLLVVSSELAGKKHLKRLLGMAKANKSEADEASVAQLLFRASPEAEKEQLALLRKYPSPQILITTPTRLMDILQSDFRSRLNIKQLSSIYIDDADVLLPQEKFILKTKTQKVNNHTKPTVELGNYVASVRNGYMRSELMEFPPLQIVFAGATLKPFHKRLLNSLGWSDGRPVADIGITNHNVIKAPYSVTAPDVDVKLVCKPSKRSACLNVSLPSINLGLAMEELQDIVNLSTDRQEYLKMKFAAIREFYNDRYTQTMRRRFYNKQLFVDPFYFETAADIIKSRPTERALVLTTQSFKATRYKEAFEKVGINAAHMAELDPSKMVEFCDTFFATPVDPSNEATKDLPQAIVCSLRQFKGIELPNLSNVIVFGWESLEEESDFALVANMCNSKESIKARNDDKYSCSKRGQMCMILNRDDAHDEVLMERIAYTVTKAGVQLDEEPIEVRALPELKKPKRLGKKKAAIAERKALREAALLEQKKESEKTLEKESEKELEKETEKSDTSGSPDASTIKIVPDSNNEKLRSTS